MSGQVITALTGIKTEITISLVLLVAAAYAAPEPSLPLPSIIGPKPQPEIRLAAELYGEGNWSACRTECRRVLAAQPGHGAATLLLAIAQARSRTAPTNTLARLCISEKLTPEMRGVARCELADALLDAGKVDSATGHYKAVFQSTRSRALLQRSARALTALLRDHPSIARKSPGLAGQLDTCADIWRRSPKPRPAAKQRKRAWTALPVEWVISFYRTQISPAIGRRCSLTPSCSEYALRALRRHGLLGLSIYADRAVREPEIVKARKDPVRVGGYRRYRDPLTEHDCWLGKQ